MNIENSILQTQNINQDTSILEEAMNSIKAINTYADKKLKHGVNRVDLYIGDVDDSWLEEWGDEEDSTCT